MLDDKNNLYKDITHDDYVTEKVNVINNGLLGNYNKNGDYFISPAIVDELIAMPKNKKTTFRNSVFCTCLMPVYGELVFEVTFEKNTSNNTALATIFVLENEYKVNGYLQNTIKTEIGNFVGDLDGFVEKSYDEFNIKLSADNGDGKKYNILNDQNLDGYIVAKKQFTNIINRLTEEKYDKIYQKYFTKRLELMQMLNSDFSKKVLEKFNLEYSKIEKFFLQNKDYKSLSELLDKCVEDVYGVNPNFKDQEKEYREKMLPIILIFSKEAETILENASVKAKEMLNKDDKKRVDEIENNTKTIKTDNKKQKPPVLDLDGSVAKSVKTGEASLKNIVEKINAKKEQDSKTNTTSTRDYMPTDHNNSNETSKTEDKKPTTQNNDSQILTDKKPPTQNNDLGNMNPLA